MRSITSISRSAGAALVLSMLIVPVIAQRPGGPGPQGPGGPPQGPGGPPRGQGGPPLRPFGGDRPNGPGRGGPPPPGPGGLRRPPEAQLDFAAAEMLGNRQVVKSAPYSAEAVTEMVQILADGTRITNKSTAFVARDSEGRTRRELKLDNLGPFVVTGRVRDLVLLNDPAIKTHYWLDAEEKSARMIREPKNPPPFDPEQGREGFAQGKVESLGTRTIEGVSAEGTRSTITIPVGEIGNDRPLEIVSERWYSPELQMVVLSKHSDPRHGEHSYRLVNLKRAEPDATLFRVPADYRIHEEQPRRPGPGPGGRGPQERPEEQSPRPTDPTSSGPN